MTKKSQARLARDELKARTADEGVDQTWDQIEAIYDDQRSLFVEYYKMAALMSQDDVRMYLINESATTNLMKGLASDSAQLQAETEEQHNKHAGRSGPPADNEEDYFAITMLHQEYAMLMSKHQQTLLPIMLQLTEHLHEALDRRRLAEAAAVPAGDVTDVVATEVEPSSPVGVTTH